MSSSHSVAREAAFRSHVGLACLLGTLLSCSDNTYLQSPTITEGLYDVDGTVLSVRSFGAVGDGTHDDTSAIQDAIDAAEASPNGAAVYLPPGTYVISTRTGRSVPYLTIQQSRITVFGHGDQSILRFVGWGERATRPGYFVVGNRTKDIERVVFRDLRLEGDHDFTSGALGDGRAQPSAAVVIGEDSDRFAVHHSGFERVHAARLGGPALAFGFPVADPVASEDVEWPRALGNFVVRSRIEDTSASGIVSFRRGQSAGLVSENVLDRVGGTGIQWWGTQSIVSRNSLSHVEGSAIVLDWAPRQDGWTMVTDNNVFDVGDAHGDEHVAPAIQVGQHRGVSNVLVSGNTVRRVHGSGIVLEGRGDSRNVVFRDNVVDEFGVGALGRTPGDPNGTVGIALLNAYQLYVIGNIVRAATGPNDYSRVGIITGGGDGMDTWTDRNVTTGPFTDAAFHQGISAPNGGGVRNRVGTNFDLASGNAAAPSGAQGAPMLAAFAPGDVHPSVAGFQVWSVIQHTPTVIEDLRDGSVGQTVTLVFDGAPTTIRDVSLGAIQLREDFVSTPGSTLVLIRGTGAWHEISRSIN